MDELTDAAPFFREDDLLFKAYVKDAYYHLRLQKRYQRFL